MTTDREPTMPENKPEGILSPTETIHVQMPDPLVEAHGQLALTEQRLRDLVELVGQGHPEDICDECHEMRQYYGHKESERGTMGGFNADGQIIGHQFFSYAAEPEALIAARKHLDREIASEGQEA